ncbi:MAG: PQQ-binding-like beta-propeller repeat protein [Planctomycetota bacterium]
MLTLTLAVLLACPQDFGNLGGDATRSGSSTEIGPRAATPLWTSNTPSVFGGAFPHIFDGAVFSARQTAPATAADPMDRIEARDLETGAVLWTAQVPWAGDPMVESRAWIAGVADGRVFALRTRFSLEGQPVHAFDAATGAFLWSSSDLGAVIEEEGAVFAPNGDPVIGGESFVARLDAVTGATLWSTPRRCNFGESGATIFGDAVYIVDFPFFDSWRLVRLDLATGARTYFGAELNGIPTGQNQPFCGPDGTVYWPRVVGPPVTALVALEDTGMELRERWSFPMLDTEFHHHGVGSDGSVYTFDVQGRIVRLDPATGSVLHTGPALLDPNRQNRPLTLVDGAGNVYVSNVSSAGSVSEPSGRLWCLSPDLSRLYFELVTSFPRLGGPALGGDGVLAFMDIDGLRTYRESEVGTALCTSITPNSTGEFGETVARGSLVATSDRLHLTARNLPRNAFGYFIVSQGFDPLASAGGNLNFCLDGSIGRYVTNVQSSGAFGRFQQVLDLTEIPQPTGAVPGLAGQTWYFQSWHRDSVGGAATFDFSHVVEMTLQ